MELTQNHEAFENDDQSVTKQIPIKAQVRGTRAGIV